MEEGDLADNSAGAQDPRASGLADELSRRLKVTDPVPFAIPDNADGSRPQPRILCEERHDAAADDADGRFLDHGTVSRWRQKEKLKTTSVALVLCLNIGVDPPDVIKISPCARLECWVDPMSQQPAKALDTIGKNLQAQYERWQPRAKYKIHLDPTVDDVKKLCMSCRKNAKNERVLFHYNGHGVPRPTANGELWVFNSRYTQYIPLSIYELQSWLGTPSIYVLDCSAAGLIVNAFRSLLEQRSQDAMRGAMGMYGYGQGAPGMPPGAGVPPGAAGPPGAGGADPLKEVIVLAACGANELLPQTPELPADVFAACLTTPIKVALRWFCSRSLMRADGLTKDLIDRIPGTQTERKTPLGELNWIFTAITDTIAWNVLPRPLFQKLFRSDLLVASLFRNFLLAERIMSSAGCTPVSFPRLPPTAQHPMWQAWDLAAEMCLMQLPTLSNDQQAEFAPSTFFAEQLTAFELWLAHGSRDKKPPEQLPIVLQVLLSQVHRLRALVLLGRFLDMGPWAVELALSVGIFPYVLKLLQTNSMDLRSTLVFIWCKVMAHDRTCQVDLIKDVKDLGGHVYFIKYLDTMDSTIDFYSRAQAAFVLSVICDGHPRGQVQCAAHSLLPVLLRWLRSLAPINMALAPPGHALLLRWLCLCIGKQCEDMPEISLHAIREGAADILVQLISSPLAEIRASAVFGLGCLIHSCPELHGQGHVAGGPGAPPLDLAGLAGQPSEERLPAEQLIGNAVTTMVYDPAVLVRVELCFLFARFVRGHGPHVRDALAVQQRRLEEVAAAQARMASGSRAGAADASTSDGQAAGANGYATGAGSRQQRGSASGTDGNPSGSVGNNWGGSGGSGTGTPGGSGGAAAGAAPYQRPPSAPPNASGGQPPAQASGSAQAPGTGRPPPSSAYLQIAEAITMLALDPAPKVARLGRDVLRIAQFELSFSPLVAGVPPVVGHPLHANGSMSPRSLRDTSITSGKFKPRSWRGGLMGFPALSRSTGEAHDAGAAGSVGSGAGGSVGARRSAQPVGPGGLAVSAPSTGTSTSASPPSPGRDMPLAYSRHPYLLRTTGLGAGAGLGGGADALGGPAAGSSVGAMSVGDYDGSSGMAMAEMRAHGGHGLALLQQEAAAAAAAAAAAGRGSAASPPPGPPVPMPRSLIYALSCEYFSRPMLEPQASSWRESEGAKLSPWTASVDMDRKARRKAMLEGGAAACRAMRTPKLKEQLHTVETGAEPVCALCFHPYHQVLVSADVRGIIRAHTWPEAKLLNSFHVTNGAAVNDSRVLPTPVVYVTHINETDGPLLLAGSADGAVRVWRSHLNQGQQRMATALQAVEAQLVPTLMLPTVYQWSAQTCHLFAAGGKQPDRIYVWDLLREHCHAMLSVAAAGAASGGGHGSPAGVGGGSMFIEQLLLSSLDPSLLVPVCTDGTMRIFDMRAPRGPRLVLQPMGRAPLAGAALEPGGKPGLLVVASEKGEMKWLDLRGASGGPNSAPEASGGAGGAAVATSDGFTTKTLQAHTKGGVCAVAGHSLAPLLATGTSSQVVKIWTDDGDVVGTLRPGNTSTLLSPARVGPITAMGFHPYSPVLAAAGLDHCTVYELHDPSMRSSSMMG